MSVERVKRASGEVVWRVRWRDGGGHNRSKVLGRKRDADAFDAEIKRRRRTGELAALDGGRETLNEYLTSVWSKAHATHLAPATRELYGYLYDSYIGPAFGQIPLREISAEGIAQWQAALLDAGLGRSATKKAMTLLGNILQRAAESGRIAANPQRVVRKVRVPRSPEVQPLAPSTIEAMRAASSLRDATLISLLAYAGLRPQEALALRWRHVGDRTLIVNAEKTGSRRSVRLLSPLVVDLGEWREASRPACADDFVIPAADGRRWTKAAYQSWRRRSFDRAAATAGAPAATPYSLRHSFCSLLLAEGRSVIEVARQLGHGANLTLGTYGHVIDELAGADRADAEAVIMAARREADVPVSYLSGLARGL